MLPKLPQTMDTQTPKGKGSDFTISWTDLKVYCLQALQSGVDSLGLRPANARVFRENLCNPGAWHGFTRDQIEKWLQSGYSTTAIQGLAEFTPPIREKRKLVFDEEGDEFHLDLAYSGSDRYMSYMTKQPNIPGVALDCVVTFSAAISAQVVNAYNAWICQTAYSLESAGIDAQITLNFRVEDTIVGYKGLTNTKVKVKSENELTDFVSFSPMLSPAAFRAFLFCATALHAESKSRDASYGLGRGPSELQFGVKHDPAKSTIQVTSQREGNPKEFPADRMTREFRQALLETMKAE